jgi:pimeloyl-ACP methyl ester carboxylesterase
MRVDAARWLNELVDALAVDRINLVGCSMGGFFALAFATAHPELVRRLILTGSAPGIFYKFPPVYHMLASRTVGRRMMAMPQSWDRETYRKRILSPLVVHPEFVPDALLDVIRAGSGLPGTADTRFTEMHSMVTLRGLRRELRMRDQLTALALPTLLIWGPHDHLAPTAVAEELVSRMDSAQLVLLEDAGHIPHFDQPARAADAINAFIA